MNRSLSSFCDVTVYLNMCTFSKVLLLVPGLALNVFVLAALASCILGGRSRIKKNVATFILGSATGNIVNLALWPLTMHWRAHGRWALGHTLCEVMVSVKHVTSSASFHYTAFISFSIYLTIVCGWSRAVDRKAFLALQLLFPFVPVLMKELGQRLLGSGVDHLDEVNHTCFSFINDKAMQILMLVKIVVFLPLNLYFYVHILHTIFRSAKEMNRSQAANKRLAKIFGVISLITVMAHIPGVRTDKRRDHEERLLGARRDGTASSLEEGGVFSLLAEQKVCLETVMEFLLDLPLLSCPIILLCMNKDLRDQCVLILQRKACSQHRPPLSTSGQRQRCRYDLQ
ncbi:hypothetical protein AAFF_G00110980 [Aldrovandia affinis]|uniref:G-protein coupled receptors family 1 profile domain-containing protein n=1 Tax=Aldrovandia affinis TaxID=143900 RepID=A0AAD7RTG7_9TELE|nr:hypothetical protein AAFF_G00110980 [Aldrovandia affinis]